MPEPKMHDLKCWPPYFEDVAAGRKTFELRLNDRDYGVGDWLRLREWDSVHGYTGRSVVREVTYVLDAAGPFGKMIADGWCLMSIARVNAVRR